jgi:hypothetical protein
MGPATPGEDRALRAARRLDRAQERVGFLFLLGALIGCLTLGLAAPMFGVLAASPAAR